MKIKYAAASAAFFLCLVTPALAQDVSYTPGTYWEVSMVDVEDGKEQDYYDHLAAQWHKSNEWAKSKGYIKNHHVLQNSNPRDGEPDLFLVVEFEKMDDPAEQLRQQKELEAFMQRTQRQLSSESGTRVTMRRLKGSMLLRELNLKAR